ncbi:MAG: hypothetical protein K0S24_2970 [Sphingobacterium sp.]|jgi:hypothetical protein|nr:hypothetical protein [Sphingobacterium sp.]
MELKELEKGRLLHTTNKDAFREVFYNGKHIGFGFFVDDGEFCSLAVVENKSPIKQSNFDDFKYAGVLESLKLSMIKYGLKFKDE